MRNRIVGTLALCFAVTVAGSGHARDDKKQKQTDEEITKLLVGKWIVDEVDDKNETKIKGIVHYKKDGTVDAEATIEAGTKKLDIKLSGTWKVTDGVIVATVTKTNVPDIIKEGVVSKDKVISIDEKELKYKDERDKEKVEKRMKE